MVPQGIRPVVQLTAVEVTHRTSDTVSPKLTHIMSQSPSSVFMYPDSSMGPEEHEAVPAGLSVFTQPGGGVWGSEGGVSCNQEHEKEPELSQLCPIHQSGNGRVAQARFSGMEKNN